MSTLGQKGRVRGPLIIAVLLVIAVTAYVYWALSRPLPAIKAQEPTVSARTMVPQAGSLAWPGVGQSAVGIADSDILQTHGKQAGEPTASTAKLITVLCVLSRRPLTAGQQGPVITMADNDVAIYKAYVAKQGSVVPVKAGEQITEYQALQAILLPSANNMADSLAIWAFGSLSNYAAYANDYVRQLGLTDTHIGADASGFDPSTVSSARDLVKLGEMAMRNPVLTQIVGQPTATGIPDAGTVRNVNFLLGTDNIVGVKTGNTDQAGGVFVAAARVTRNGKPVTVVTALLGAPDLFTAMKDSQTLIRSAQNNFQAATVIRPGTVAGRYTLPWGGSVSAAAGRKLDLSGWAGGDIPFTVSLRPIPAGSKAGSTVGQLTVKESAFNKQVSIPLILKTTPTEPSTVWRLLHPLG